MVSPSKDLTDQLKNALDDPMSESISTKYYEPYELTPLMKNKTSNITFFYLNISSLYFHIEEFTICLGLT